MSRGALSAPVALDEAHDCTLFDCGEPSLNDWLRRHARANQVSGAARTFVVCRDGYVVGYYALAAGAVASVGAPGRMRRSMPDPTPVAALGRLAIDRTLQGQGIGRALLRDAGLRVIQAAEAIAIRGILVQAIREDARRFCIACGFVPSPGDPILLMATLGDVTSALG